MSKALDDLIKRCQEAELQYNLMQPTGLKITFSEGGNDPRLVVRHDKVAEMLLEVPFEKWRPIPGYKALWSPELGVIECEMHHAASPDSDFYVFEFEDEADGWELLEEAWSETTKPEPLFAVSLFNELLFNLGRETKFPVVGTPRMPLCSGGESPPNYRMLMNRRLPLSSEV